MEIREIDTQKILGEIEKEVEKIFYEFSRLKVAVFGDSMLDSYLIGDTTRISPEAPVPVVHISKSYFKPGGAANTAVNIKKIGGCKVKLFSVVGEDKEGNILEDLMKKEGVEVFFVRDRSRPTTQKTRVIARGQHVVRIDTEKTHNIEYTLAEKIISELKEEEFDVIVLSDYAKGFFSENITNAIKEKETQQKFYATQNLKI
jgi:ADP-heptose synthase, bifunctional sugar kinase/adenylyltransferase